jgi:hypothetical protein
MYRILDRSERSAAAVVSAVCIAPTFIRLQALVHRRNVSDYLQIGMAVNRLLQNSRNFGIHHKMLGSAK